MAADRPAPSPDLTQYRDAVSAEMERQYGITWHDASGDMEPLERAIARGDTPEDFVSWWGEKYDLEPVEPTPRAVLPPARRPLR